MRAKIPRFLAVFTAFFLVGQEPGWTAWQTSPLVRPALAGATWDALAVPHNPNFPAWQRGAGRTVKITLGRLWRNFARQLPRPRLRFLPQVSLSTEEGFVFNPGGWRLDWPALLGFSAMSDLQDSPGHGHGPADLSDASAMLSAFRLELQRTSRSIHRKEFSHAKMLIAEYIDKIQKTPELQSAAQDVFNLYVRFVAQAFRNKQQSLSRAEVLTGLRAYYVWCVERKLSAPDQASQLLDLQLWALNNLRHFVRQEPQSSEPALLLRARILADASAFSLRYVDQPQMQEKTAAVLNAWRHLAKDLNLENKFSEAQSVFQIGAFPYIANAPPSSAFNARVPFVLNIAVITAQHLARQNDPQQNFVSEVQQLCERYHRDYPSYKDVLFTLEAHRSTTRQMLGVKGVMYIPILLRDRPFRKRVKDLIMRSYRLASAWPEVALRGFRIALRYFAPQSAGESVEDLAGHALTTFISIAVNYSSKRLMAKEPALVADMEKFFARHPQAALFNAANIIIALTSIGHKYMDQSPPDIKQAIKSFRKAQEIFQDSAYRAAHRVKSQLPFLVSGYSGVTKNMRKSDPDNFSDLRDVLAWQRELAAYAEESNATSEIGFILFNQMHVLLNLANVDNAVILFRAAEAFISKHQAIVQNPKGELWAHHNNLINRFSRIAI